MTTPDGSGDNYEGLTDVEKYRRIVAKEPEDSNNNYNLGWALIQSRGNEIMSNKMGPEAKEAASEAEKCLKKAIQLYRGHGRAHTLLSQLYRYTGRFEEAIPHASFAMTMPPGSQDWFTAAETLASSHMSLNRIPEAIEVIDQILEHFPDNPMILFKAGACEEGARNYEKAHARYTHLLEVSPGNPQARAGLLRVEKYFKPQASQAAAKVEAGSPAENKSAKEEFVEGKCWGCGSTERLKVCHEWPSYQVCSKCCEAACKPGYASNYESCVSKGRPVWKDGASEVKEKTDPGKGDIDGDEEDEKDEEDEDEDDEDLLEGDGDVEGDDVEDEEDDEDDDLEGDEDDDDDDEDEEDAGIGEDGKPKEKNGGENDDLPWPEKIALCRKSLDKEPGNANRHYNLGWALINSVSEDLYSGKTGPLALKVAAEAEKHLKDALGIASNHGRAHLMLGQLYRYTGRYQEAIKMARFAMGLPNWSEDWFAAAETVASSYMSLEKSADALPILEQIDQIHADDPMILFKLGACYWDAGRLQEALSTFERMKTLAPGDANADQFILQIKAQMAIEGDGGEAAAKAMEEQAIRDAEAAEKAAVQKAEEAAREEADRARLEEEKRKLIEAGVPAAEAERLKRESENAERDRKYAERDAKIKAQQEEVKRKVAEEQAKGMVKQQKVQAMSLKFQADLQALMSDPAIPQDQKTAKMLAMQAQFQADMQKTLSE